MTTNMYDEDGDNDEDLNLKSQNYKSCNNK